MRKGFTLAEILVVMGIIVILAVISLASFVGRRNQSQISTTVAAMAGLLREAQSRAVAQASSSAWGVHFDNGSTPFFALFSGTYSSTSLASYYPLPVWVGYVTSSVASGSAAEVTFAQLSGAASGSSSISLYLFQNPTVSSTVSIASSGSISY